MPGRAPCLRVLHDATEVRGTLAWEEYLQAHAVYIRNCNEKRSKKVRYVGIPAERLAQLGGLGYDAVTRLLGHEPTTWRALSDEVADE